MTIFDEDPVFRILTSLGRVTMKNFDNRLRLQKISFLVQELGGFSSFPFTWYHRGPYSQELSKLLFKGQQIGAFETDVTLTKEEQKVVNILRELLSDRLDDSDVLELFASIWYLLPQRVSPENDYQSVVDVIKETKPRYENQQVREALARILKFKNTLLTQ